MQIADVRSGFEERSLGLRAGAVVVVVAVAAAAIWQESSRILHLLERARTDVTVNVHASYEVGYDARARAAAVHMRVHLTMRRLPAGPRALFRLRKRR